MDIALYDVVILPFIIGLVQVLKKTGLPTRFVPVVSIFFGALIGVIYLSPQDIAQGILVGTAIGLSASGLYSGTKTVVEKSDD